LLEQTVVATAKNPGKNIRGHAGKAAQADPRVKLAAQSFTESE
jgi:hypothetical protein